MSKPSISIRFVLLAAFALGAVLLGNSSCKKELKLTEGGELRFSTDTLSFDTVFTTMGSATLGFKIYNPQSQRVTVSSVRMAGGAASPFRLNVDGNPGGGTNFEIAANDSAYVFATVKVDPNDQNSPFVVEDRLIATLNGTDFSLPLMAYGQNAHYIVNDTAMGDTTLLTDKPYVIIGYAAVPSGQTLRISQGTRIYMHQNARIFVYGTLNAVGTKTDSIIFQGDRLDRAYYGYEGYPGEWGGIWFDTYSRGSFMKHVILRNCGRPTQFAAAAAIQVNADSTSGATTPGNQLTLENCTVENSIGYGLLAFGGTIKATNCVMHSCGATTLALVEGGYYEFTNCTFATYGNTKISHTENPVAVIRNYYSIPNVGYWTHPLQATLTNCVVAGSLEHEFDAERDPQAPASLILTNCFLKAIPDSVRSFVQQNDVKYIRPNGTNEPMFVDISKWNYRLKPGSPLVDAGIGGAGIPAFDMDGEPRPKPGTRVDVGAYESF